MTKFYYTSPLNDEVVDPAELNQRFADIQSYLNVTKIGAENIDKSALRYRHLREPQTFFLHRYRTSGSDIGGGSVTLADKTGATWNVLAGTAVQFTSTKPDLNGSPVGHVHVEYESVRFNDPHEYALGIGYSTDGGLTYTLLPNAFRHFGKLNTHDPPTHGIAHPIWTALQTHPFTRVASTYRPGTSYAHRPLYINSPLVHDTDLGLPDPRTVTHYAAMIKAGCISGAATRDLHNWDRCRIWLVASDNGL